MPGKFVITKTPKGFYRFSLLAANHQTIMTSQNYASLQNCKDGIISNQKNAMAPIEDLTLRKVKEISNPKFSVYLDKAGQYRYRLIASNGQNISSPEDGYKSKSGVMNGIKSIGKSAVDAVIDESALNSTTT
jgi:uncharacterized protein